MKSHRFFFIGLMMMVILSFSVAVGAADTYPQLTITSQPTYLVYGLGEEPDLAGIKASYKKSSSSTALTLDSSQLRISRYDSFSTPGIKTVTIGYESSLTSYSVYVMDYTRVRQDRSGYPEYTNYGRRENNVQEYTCEGAEGLLLQFSSSSRLDNGGDYVDIYDKNGTEIASFTDREISGALVFVSGDYFKVRLTSDREDEYYGYSLSAIWAVDADSCPHLYGEESVTTPTCEKDGSKVKVCAGCGRVDKTILPKLSSDGKHSYNYEEAPGYVSQYDLRYYDCLVCGYSNLAWNYGYCGNFLMWILLKDNTMVIYPTGNSASYTMTSIPAKANQARALYIQNGIVNIYPNAFYQNYGLSSVHLPDTLQTVGDAAFYSCGLTELSFSGALTSIGTNAFRLCNGLTSVDFGTSSPIVGEYAFAYCDALEQIDFGTGAVVLGQYAFEFCEKIQNVDIPERVTLEKRSFGACKGLESVTIRCDEIPTYCFESCFKLETVTIYDKDADIDSTAFSNINRGQLTIRGPGCSSAAAYAKKYAYSFSATDQSSHTMLVTQAVTPTCQIEGFTEGESCTSCGYVSKVRTSLGLADHQMSEWKSVSASEHSRGCIHCDTQDMTASHERKGGYCSVCGDDDLMYALQGGTLTLFASQGGLEGMTVICAVYSETDQLLLCGTTVWDNKPTCEITLAEAEDACYVKIFCLTDWFTLRPVLTANWP